TPTWTPMTGTLPPGRQGAAMAYDPVRDEAILFGGLDGRDRKLRDTWRLKFVNGTPQWTPIQSNAMWGLIGWKSVSMAWNASRQRIVLFSARQDGFEPGSIFVQHTMWEWDGQDWVSIVEGQPPSLREYQNMAATSASGDIHLFGGRTPSTLAVLNDTYRLRGPVGPIQPYSGISGGGPIACGATATLTMPDVPGLNLVYRWYKDGVLLPNGPTGTGSVISGAGTPALRIAYVTPGDTAAYSCNVDNACSPTGITVGLGGAVEVSACCPADFNGDGGVDGDDVIGFFQLWDSGDPGADFNRDGGVDGDDVIGFFERWDAGC
ncbi:MAG: GC-type dockerin domain-anchored protein, partial [Phycisphaerales bacterium]